MLLGPGIRQVALWATALAVCLRLLLPALHHHHAASAIAQSGAAPACCCGHHHAAAVPVAAQLSPASSDAPGQQNLPGPDSEATPCAACHCEQSSPGGALPETVRPRGQHLQRLVQRSDPTSPPSVRRGLQQHSRAPPRLPCLPCPPPLAPVA
jgi:hypothetical protein